MSEYRVKLRSNYVDGTVNLNIIMPNPFVGHDPGRFYSSGVKYPVLWLLHGSCRSLDDWITYTYAPRLSIWRNVILVAPETPGCIYTNQLNMGEGFRYTDFFFKELRSFLYNWFPASDRREDNYIAGCGLGAQAVWQYITLHPEAFQAAAPIGSLPRDYSWLTPWRELDSDAFKKLLRENASASLRSLSRREINNICKYPDVGTFLDSIDNTLPRFREAASFGHLPGIFLPLKAGTEGLDSFKQLAKAAHLDIRYDMETGEAEEIVFLERSLENFMNYAGLDQVESTLPDLPILCGVHSELDDATGITIH